MAQKDFQSNNRSLLLHCCCAPCAPHIARTLADSYNVHLFFYNPNIFPEEEYRLREREIRTLAEHAGLPLELGAYDDASWREAVIGFEAEPEGGGRCDVCFDHRLDAAARPAKRLNITLFTTTLTVSPHKNAARVNAAGRAAAERIGGVSFLEADFKKKDGFKKSCDIAREHGFYRQDYCGCEFSRRKQE